MTLTVEQVAGLLDSCRAGNSRAGAAAVWVVLPAGEAVAVEDITTEPSDHESGLSVLIRAAAPEVPA